MEIKKTDKVVTKRKSVEQHKEELRGKSLNGLNVKLHAKERAGYMRRFVKDDPKRIAYLQDLGYTFAEDSEGETCKKVSGSHLGANLGRTREGPNTQGLLMEIPTERYQAIQELKAEQIDAVEAEILEGNHDNTIEPDLRHERGMKRSISRT